MTSPLAFLSARRRRSPLSGSFFAPGDLSVAALIHVLASLYADAAASVQLPARFQRRNTLALSRMLHVLVALFEGLKVSLAPSPTSALPRRFPSSAVLCLRELYIFIYRAKLLLEYCSQSSRLWLLLRGPQISGNFHDLSLELATLLDVLPLQHLLLPADVREQMELLRSQCWRSEILIHPDDEELRCKIYFFLDQFEEGKPPDTAELRSTFCGRLGIRDSEACRREIEFLEEQICSREEDMNLNVVSGVVALTRYCRFLLFGFQEMEIGRQPFVDRGKASLKRLVSQAGSVSSRSGDFSLTIPKDFCCPISLDLMKDPVVVCTGQTYDRASIAQWIEEGHRTCPNSGQALSNNHLVPNKALKSLISQWCAAYGLPKEPLDDNEASAESIMAASSSTAAGEANRATIRILIRQLSAGIPDSKIMAARELRFLAKTGKDNRSLIAKEGGIPSLCRLLRSTNAAAQEHAVTAILNTSIHDDCKSLIMEEEGCLKLIVYVLRHGLTSEARENAAATLFSLSVVHDFKKMIADEEGAVVGLLHLLTQGSARGKKDAAMALFNLSIHPDNWLRMLDSGAVSSLVAALKDESVSEEAAGVLTLLMKQPVVAETVGRNDSAIANLVELMRRGSPRRKENAVAALQEMCRRGGPAVTQRVARTPTLGGLIQSILVSGTKRARKKAASLARMCQRCGLPAATNFGNHWITSRAIMRTNSLRSVSFRSGGDASVVASSVRVPLP